MPAQAQSIETEYAGDEAREVLRWRFTCLTKAGLDTGTATVLALHNEVDLHQACDMARQNCPAELLRRILLDDPPRGEVLVYTPEEMEAILASDF